MMIYFNKAEQMELELQLAYKELNAFREQLESIQAFDLGLLGGDRSWTVGQWHDYIRNIVAEVQAMAKV